MDQYKDFRIHLWSFDTAVFNPQVFTPDNADEIEDYVLGSGGGTEFECNWEYMKSEGIEPKKFIMFTDGWPFDSWGDPDYCDTVFLINNKYERNIEAPFGLTLWSTAFTIYFWGIRTDLWLSWFLGHLAVIFVAYYTFKQFHKKPYTMRADKNEPPMYDDVWGA
jgi:hypothetical protein